MSGESGFSYCEAGLDAVTRQLREGGRRLDNASGASIDAPDAGASSEVVGTAIVALLKSAVAAAHLMDNNADLVDTANGSYGPTENNNAGRMWHEYERDGSSVLRDHNYPMN